MIAHNPPASKQKSDAITCSTTCFLDTLNSLENRVIDYELFLLSSSKSFLKPVILTGSEKSCLRLAEGPLPSFPCENPFSSEFV